MNLFFVVGFLFLVYKIMSLGSRVQALEQKLQGVKFHVVKKGESYSPSPLTKNTTEDISEERGANKNPEEEEKRDAYVYSHEPGYMERFIAWYKQDWMLKTGAFLMLLGVGWFTTYAFMENWIGPLGRVTLGFVLGLSFLVYGWKKMHEESFVKQAGVFFTVGASIIILTAYSARALYDMFSAPTVVGIIFAVSVIASLSAVRFLPTLGYASLFMGGLAPILSHSSENNYVLLFSYLLVVVLGSHIVVHLTGKRGIILAGLIMVSFYSAPYIWSDNFGHPKQDCHWTGGNRYDHSRRVSSYDSNSYYNAQYVCEKPQAPNVDYGVLLLFAYGFAMISFLASIIGILVSVKERTLKIVRSDLLTGILTAVFLIGWVLRAGQKEFQSLILVAWTMVFVIGAYLLFMRVKERAPFYVYALVGIILLGTATGIEFEGVTRIIAYTLEAMTVVLGSLFILQDKKVATTMTGFFIVPVLLSFELIGRVGYFMDRYVITLFFLSLTLLGISYVLYKKEKELSESNQNYALFKAYLITGSLYFWYLVWVNCGLVFLSSRPYGYHHSSNGTALALIIYTLSGLSLYVYGKKIESKGIALYGSVLSIFVIAHLLLIDVWNMSLFGKVVTFFTVGGLLMTTAFSAKKHKE